MEFCDNCVTLHSAYVWCINVRSSNYTWSVRLKKAFNFYFIKLSSSYKNGHLPCSLADKWCVGAISGHCQSHLACILISICLSSSNHDQCGPLNGQIAPCKHQDICKKTICPFLESSRLHLCKIRIRQLLKTTKILKYMDM